MLKKVLISALLLVLLLSLGLFFWVRAVFTQDSVRTALARQLSEAIGQPVDIGSIAATIYPRVTVNLGRVSIGAPHRVRIQTLHVGTDFSALLSRRIEHATLGLSGARVELPLPPFSIRSRSATRSAPVEIVSIDAIVLRGVEIISGGRTLTADVEVVPQGRGLTLRNVTLGAGRAMAEVTGQIADLSGPVGELAIKARALDLDQLLAFAADFATGSGIGTTARAGTISAPVRRTGPTAIPPGAPPMNVAVSLESDRATIGTLTLDKLVSRARVTSEAITLEPIGFGLFGGRQDGSLVITPGALAGYRLRATLSGIDMVAVTAIGGSPGLITGRLSGTLSLTGRGTSASTALKRARGTSRVDIVDGVVRNLGLVRTAVVAMSGRSDGGGAAGSKDEPFTRLGATLTIDDGAASTQDLRLESKDLLLTAADTVRLDGSAVNLAGHVQLSDELSGQAGRDLFRYTQEGGRVTLPATITDTADAPQVRIDVTGVLGRALSNRANEEMQKLLKKGLGGLIKK